MVIDKKKHSDKPRLNQGSSAAIAEPNKIAASTHFDFQGKNLTPYGGLFPVATMLAQVRHDRGQKTVKSFRISSRNRGVYTTFSIQFEPLREAEAQLSE